MRSSCARAGCTRDSPRSSSWATWARATSSARRSLRALLVLMLAAVLPAHAETVKVGSKRFTESYILGELLARAAGGEHRPGLGNTAIVFAALKGGAIDLYPEYSGTLAKEILKLDAGADLAVINRALER